MNTRPTDDRSESASTISRASVYQPREQQHQPQPYSARQHLTSSISRSQSLRLSGGSSAHDSPAKAYDSPSSMASAGRQHRNGYSMSMSRGSTVADHLHRSQSVYGDAASAESSRYRHSSLTPSRSVTSNLASADSPGSRILSPAGSTMEEARAEAKRRRQSLLREGGASIDVTPHRTLKLSGGLRDRFVYSEPRPASSIGSPSRLDRHLPPGTTPSPTRAMSRMAGEQTIPRSAPAPAHLKLNRASLLLPKGPYRDYVPESPLARQRDRAASRMSLIEPRVGNAASARHSRLATSPTGSAFTTMTSNGGGGETMAARATTNRVMAALRKADNEEARALMATCLDLFETLPDDPSTLPLRHGLQQAISKADKVHAQLVRIEAETKQQSVDCEMMSPEEAQMTAIAGYQDLLEHLSEVIRTSSDHMSSLTRLLRTMADSQLQQEGGTYGEQGDLGLTRSFGRLALANDIPTVSQLRHSPAQKQALDDAGSSSGGSSAAARSRRSQYAPSPQGTPRGSSAVGRADWSLAAPAGESPERPATHRQHVHDSNLPSGSIVSGSQPLSRRRSNASTIGQSSSAFLRTLSSQAPTTALSQVNAGLADDSPTDANFQGQDDRQGSFRRYDNADDRVGESPMSSRRSTVNGSASHHGRAASSSSFASQPHKSTLSRSGGSAYDRLAYVRSSANA